MDKRHNGCTDGWITTSPKEIQGIGQTKHLVSIMVLGVICSDGKKPPLIFFEPKVDLDMTMYYWAMRYKVLPWILAKYPDGNY